MENSEEETQETGTWSRRMEGGEGRTWHIIGLHHSSVLRPYALYRGSAASTLGVNTSMGHGGSANSFCDCFKQKGRDFVCSCGEDDSVFEWVWDDIARSAATQLSVEHREVKFHLEYSCGTAAVRGNKPLKNRQYFWEIKMTTPVYGTDMMVGVGTAAANLDKYQYTFCSLLGSDAESWGLSYTGTIHHQGETRRYAPNFGQGTIIGIHLDTWNGTLAFFKNRRPLGIAYKNLRGKELYPMVSSTAARSGMKVIKSTSFDSSLQYMCIQTLRKIVPPDISLVEALSLPPGLRTFLENNLNWLISPCSPGSSDNDDEIRTRGRKRLYPDANGESLLSCKRRCYTH